MALCMLMENTLVRFKKLPLKSVPVYESWALVGRSEFITACDFRLMTRKS